MHFLSEKWCLQIGKIFSQISPARLSQFMSRNTPELMQCVIADYSTPTDTRLNNKAHATQLSFNLNLASAAPQYQQQNHLRLIADNTSNIIQHPVNQKASYAVELSGVSKAYPHHTQNQASPRILNDVYLNIIPGETVVLLGPSGCGKSTLLRLLNGLEKPDSGVISVNGTCFNELPRGFRWDQFRAEVGMVFQQYNLFPHMTILKNIMIGATAVRKLSKKEAAILAMDLLESVGLADKAHCYPYQLSGGQKQRIAIVRALALSPQILLLDEPTSALDPVMTNEVLELIGKLSHHGVTLVIVTHEVQFALDVADRILFMHEGELIFDDAPQALLSMCNKPEIIENYLAHTQFPSSAYVPNA